MKNFIISLLTLTAISVNAQVKIGNNLTNQAPNSNLQVEGNTTNDQLVVLKNGQVAIGTVTPDPNAALDISSTTKGFMPPRLTTSQRTLIANPSPGMLIFNTDSNCVEIYNTTEGVWKGLCGENASGDAIFDTNCATLNIQGDYVTGIALNETNIITVFVNVTEIGNYNIVANINSMTFSASGEFTTLGEQQITLNGAGVPTVVGYNTVVVKIGNSSCTNYLNITDGSANVTGCHTTTTFEYGSSFNGYNPWVTGAIYPNYFFKPITLVPKSEDPSKSLDVTISGIPYSTPTQLLYGLQTSQVNGLSLYGNLNGTFGSATPASIELSVVGTPILAGNWSIPFKINKLGTTCNVVVPVRSGSAFVTAISNNTAVGNNNGPAIVGQDAGAGFFYKRINYTIGTLASSAGNGPYAVPCFFRTNTVNGVYFEGEDWYSTTTGAKTIDLYAVGTPISTGTFTYTITVSSSISAFVSTTFTYQFAQPANFPDIVTCPVLGTTLDMQYIKPTNTGTSDLFGTGPITTVNGTLSITSSLTAAATPVFQLGKAAKLSADGLTLVVGAPNEDSNSQSSPANNSLSSSGAVYVFYRANTSSAFVQQAYLKEPFLIGANYRFGASVDISNNGDRIVIGSPGTFEFGASAGKVYVYERTGSSWSMIRESALAGGSAGDQYGAAVAISGDGLYVAAGAPYEDTDFSGYSQNIQNSLSSNSGAIQIMEVNTGGAVFRKAENIGTNDLFGSSLALNFDGTILAVGAPLEDGSGKNINPQDNNSATDAGAVYIFRRTGALSTFNFESYLKPSNTLANQLFGTSLAISSTNRLVVGSPAEDRGISATSTPVTGATINSGAAYVFDRSGTTWTPKNRLKANNLSEADQFGWSVAISNDGNMIYVGSPGEDSSITALTCNDVVDNASLVNSGAIYSFALNNTNNFIQGMMFKPITGTAGATGSDYFGMNVSCTSDGKIIAYGAGYEDGSATTVNGVVNGSATDAGCVVVVKAN